MKLKISAVFFLLAFFIISSGCGKKEDLSSFSLLLNRWATSTEKMDYAVYAKTEAYPREQSVFREIYRDSCYADVQILKVEDCDGEERTDFEGSVFIKRNIIFECRQVLRAGKKSSPVRGEVFAVKFKTGSRSGDGWLLANRTLIHL